MCLALIQCLDLIGDRRRVCNLYHTVSIIFQTNGIITFAKGNALHSTLLSYNECQLNIFSGTHQHIYRHSIQRVYIYTTLPRASIGLVYVSRELNFHVIMHEKQGVSKLLLGSTEIMTQAEFPDRNTKIETGNKFRKKNNFLYVM